jgi:ABC-2 type transport system ATP-binding protein
MLRLSHVCKSYSDGTKALDQVTLQLPAGMVGLLGPNGAGKSSLMRTIACLQLPDSGTLHFNGLDLLENPASIRYQLGYLPQSFGVYPNMTCRSLLEHIAILKGLKQSDRKTQIDNLLSLTNLHNDANKKVIHFSGGMRQRFGIAQALLGNPKLIIMDEPTAGLDPEERTSLNNLLVSISQDRLIILSTHIVEDVENLCRYVAIIDKGRLIQNGHVTELIEPLSKKIWQVASIPSHISENHRLSKSFRFGQKAYRIYSKDRPCDDALPVLANLHDAYFFALNNPKAITC